MLVQVTLELGKTRFGICPFFQLVQIDGNFQRTLGLNHQLVLISL